MARPLDSRQLMAFVTVVRLQSFTLAANELHLTQSAISHSLRALETDVGCRLLERSGRRISMTVRGRSLFQAAERILGEMEQARQNLTTFDPVAGVSTAA
jgi:DNA-binding transcriptional LysR family regulator